MRARLGLIQTSYCAGLAIFAGTVGAFIPATAADVSSPAATNSTAAPAAPSTATAPPATNAPASAASSDDLLSGQAPAASAAKPAAPGAASSSDDLLSSPGASAPSAPAAGDDLLPGPAGAAGNNDLLAPGAGAPNSMLMPPAAQPMPATPPMSAESAAEAHEAMLVENRFPSATTCATCHPTQFRQWSVSQHAYAQLSPVFNSMQATIDKRTSATNGDFCIRCHTQVGMTLREPVFGTNLDRHATSREGITCITCHRVKENYGKVSGRTSVVEGDLFNPVYGPKGNKNLKYVLANPDIYAVVSKRGEVGRGIHPDVVKFDPLEKSGFCGTCHDVNLLNGFRLEEAFSQFKNSPANKRGETCQDCHMGNIPGIKSGYAFGPAAMIGDKPTPPRKLTNHMFAGPDYSIIHPGMFPHNTQAQALASLREWLQFDYEAGWGTDAFENNLPAGYVFPAKWQSVDDRYQARSILEDQFALFEEINQQRYQLLRRGFQLGDFQLEKSDKDGIKFRVAVVNGTDGHGAPTGFDAERNDFLQVTVTDRRGTAIFKSGDRDPNGDVRNAESEYVHNYELPFDNFLFSLQSKFLVTLQRGGEREQILPTNKSVDPLPYVRPATNADVIIGAPFGARKQAVVLAPHGYRWARYAVDGDALTGYPPYKVNIKFITQMVPINLVGEVAEVGFDYNMSAKEVARRIIERSQTLWNRTIVLPDHPVTYSLKPSEQDILAPPPRPFLPGFKMPVKTASNEEKQTETASSAMR